MKASAETIQARAIKMHFKCSDHESEALGCVPERDWCHAGYIQKPARKLLYMLRHISIMTLIFIGTRSIVQVCYRAAGSPSRVSYVVMYSSLQEQGWGWKARRP